MIFDSLPPALYPVFFLLGFGLIVLIIILVKKKTKIFGSDEKPKSDKEIAKEELDRILEPIEESKEETKEEKIEGEDKKQD